MYFNKLKGKMVEAGIPQHRLAELLGITVQTLNAKLNGRSSFTLEEAVKIAEILSLENPIDIFFRPDVPNMQQKARPEKEMV